MRQYETGFILSPALSEEETARFIEQMSEVVTQKQGQLVKQDIWGKRKLAYPIRRFNEGFYVFFTYEGEGEIAAELERRFKQSASVIRFLTVKKDLRDLGQRKKKTRSEEPAEAERTETEEKPAEEK